MKELGAQEAHDILQKDPDAIYLDVRSIPEFEQGHPPNAINIPLLHFQPGMGMSPNADFASVVEANLPKDKKIIVGCQSGGRSAHACEIMSRLGYQDVTNLRSGFSGAMNMMGRLVEPGWSSLQLPVCKDCSKDTQYEALSAKARK